MIKENNKKESEDFLLLQLNQTKWFFSSLCFYLVSQSITIPILPIGPWALWPTLSDVAFVCLIFTFWKCRGFTVELSLPTKRIFMILSIIFLGSVLSYISYQASADEGSSGSIFGGFQLYRLLVFFAIFWLTSKVPLTPKRIDITRWIVDGVLILVCLGVLLTYTGLIPVDSIVAHLPKVGPWKFYEGIAKSGGTKGLGFVGYNHAYVAAQVIMLIGLRIHLALNQNQAINNTILIIISLFIVFISESRSGLVSMVFFFLVYYFYKPTHALWVITLSLIIIILTIQLGLQSIELNSNEGSIIERQLTVLQANKKENLSGRDERWATHLDSLDKNPINWFVGNGFGSAIDRGDNAHMLPLQITSETGLIGLVIFSFLFSLILRYLYQFEIGERPIFWVTIAFLISAGSQETFYPTPSLGQFIGFYLCSVSIALRKKLPK
jgi:O-Antigen ligase